MKDFIKRYLIHNLYFSILSFVSVALLVTSFFLPPTGAIDPTVIAGTGEIMGIMAIGTVIHAIDKDKSVTFNHGQTSVTINGKEYKIQEINEES